MDFSPVSLEQKGQYYELWDRTPLRSLDYTLANLWGWQEFYGLEWHFAKDLCWIRQTRPEVAWWAPLGDWAGADWPAAFAWLDARNVGKFHRVPDELVQIWEKAHSFRIEAQEDRGQWEYLYNRDELATLTGNRFHKKRNHLNSYIKAYGEPDYRSVDDALINEVLSVQDDWCHWHECDDSPSLRAENAAVNRVLSRWDCFRNMAGGSLYVDGKMIAFSIGEALDPENLGIHFEKGLGGYKGVYQAINYEFANHAGEGFKWINRAQDLDEEGLRQAKMTYLPAAFLKKSTVILKKA